MTNDELQIMDNKKLRDKGELIFWGEIVLMMSVVFTGVSSSYVYDKYMAQVTQSEIDKYYNEANLYHKINNWLTIGVLGFHIYNVVDSYFVTRKSNKKSSMLLNNRFGVAVLPDCTQLKFGIRF